MRDAVFILTMAGLLPLAVFRPFVGILLWCWISFMNPHRLVYGVAMELPWAVAIFAATLIGAQAGRGGLRLVVLRHARGEA